MFKRPQWISKPIGLYHPQLHRAAIWFRTLERWAQWQFDSQNWAQKRSRHGLAFRVKKHTSVLIKRLGKTDLRLQTNKVDNLRIVIEALDGLLLEPGETFSFCRSVGRPSRRRGFKEGMQLSRGVAQPGVGGGICQASNLIFWLALHSPLQIVERHHHSFDPFPDNNRILPFASGATVMYPYRDLRLRNNTPHCFQIKLWLDKKCLNGDLRTSGRPPQSYSVFERNHRFEERGGKRYRANELWRRVRDRRTGRWIRSEFLFSNLAEVKYAPEQ